MSSARKRQLTLFLIGIALLGASTPIFETTFNNFLSDRFGITPQQRGFLEFPRELPGFLTALFMAGLFLIAETRVQSLGAVLTALGGFGFALSGDRYWAMMGSMIIWSVGAHLCMTTESAIALHLAEEGQQGRRLGQIGFVGTLAMIAGGSIVLIARKLTGAQQPFAYHHTFTVAGLLACAAGAVFLLVGSTAPKTANARPRWVYRKSYWLFYLLNLLFGIRKQVFITFGPWVLIKAFGQPPSTFATLWIINAVLGLGFKPLVGHLIDRVGERFVLMADGIIMTAVCLGYGYAGDLLGPGLGLRIVLLCYILDQTLFYTAKARDTYLSKILEQPEDMTGTLAVGTTMNHVMSMILPFFGGMLWERYGYPLVFAVAAAVAVSMMLTSSLIPPRSVLSAGAAVVVPPSCELPAAEPD